MAHTTMAGESEQRLGKTLRDDLRRGDFGRTVKRDFKELKEFMLDEQRKKQLSGMSWLGRWFYTVWWLIKSLFFKLTPARRILLTAGIVLVLVSRSVSFTGESLRVESNAHGLGVLCVVFVLMLELKDKMVARKELEAGRAVQEALMPEPSPHVPGWDLWLFTRSANEVGGDLVDFVRVGEERVGVVVSDVAGKGLSAALLTAKLQATLRALVDDARSLSDLGSRLNTIFYRDSLRSTFASLVYVELHPERGDIRVLNAGHLPPVIIRVSSIERLGKGGTALGLAPTAAFTEQGVLLMKGETLVAYTDGLTEACNEAGEFFGEQRLLDILPRLRDFSAKNAGERIVAELDRFVGDARAHDDISIAVLKHI